MNLINVAGASGSIASANTFPRIVQVNVSVQRGSGNFAQSSASTTIGAPADAVMPTVSGEQTQRAPFVDDRVDVPTHDIRGDAIVVGNVRHNLVSGAAPLD
jgi:hypothetical protein